MSPTQRSLKEMRSRGWTAQVVERWNQYAGIRQDLFGFGDIIAVKEGEGIALIQATSGSNLMARWRKITEKPEVAAKATAWKLAGGLIFVHGWQKKGPRGKRKTYQLREEVL